MTQIKDEVEQKASDIADTAGIGVGLFFMSVVWLTMVVLCNFVFDFSQIKHDDMAGLIMGTIVGGAAFGAGIGFVINAIVRFRIEMAFIREASLRRYLKENP